MNQEEKTNINETQYAVRPHHKQKRLIDNNDDMLKYRNILNIIFMVLAIVGVIVYTQADYKITATIILPENNLNKYVDKIFNRV